MRFCWTEHQKGLAKSASFYGYIVLQVIGGGLSEKFGTRIVLGTAMTCAALLTFVTPLTATLDLWALVAIRVVVGLAESVTYPSLPPLIVR